VQEGPLIIRGGQAVPPREVERILLSHPAVAEAAVAGIPDPFWDEIVGAAVRLSAPLPVAAAGLTAYCRERLAPYKVPVRWLFTGAMPRTQAGAICRATLGEQLAVISQLDGSPWSSQLPAAGGRTGGTRAARFGGLRPRPAVEDLWIPRQARRSGALDDLDHL
jgi:AMP-binding enzyme C-terminal domain